MLYYSIDDPDPDNNFTVTVVPINGAEDPPDTTITFMFSYNIQGEIRGGPLVLSLPTTESGSLNITVRQAETHDKKLFLVCLGYRLQALSIKVCLYSN